MAVPSPLGAALNFGPAPCRLASAIAGVHVAGSPLGVGVLQRGGSDHRGPKQARPQTTQTSHPDRPVQTAQTAQSLTRPPRSPRPRPRPPGPRAGPRQGQPDRGWPGRRGFIETAQFPSRCGIETGYYPIETDFRSSESNHRDGSVKSREACVREWQVELCNRKHGKGDSCLRCVSHNCDSNCESRHGT